jgi:hypothetical protein
VKPAFAIGHMQLDKKQSGGKTCFWSKSRADFVTSAPALGTHANEKRTMFSAENLSLQRAKCDGADQMAGLLLSPD